MKYLGGCSTRLSSDCDVHFILKLSLHTSSVVCGLCSVQHVRDIRQNTKLRRLVGVDHSARFTVMLVDVKTRMRLGELTLL